MELVNSSSTDYHTAILRDNLSPGPGFKRGFPVLYDGVLSTIPSKASQLIEIKISIFHSLILLIKNSINVVITEIKNPK